MGRLEALCGKIHDTHHVYLKENLPRLAALIVEAASGAIRGQGGHVPEELWSGLAQLDADLTEPIRKEEEELFPAAIRAESDFFRLQQTPEKKEVAG